MINYGIIGTGGIAKIHAEIIKDLPNAYLFGAHDIVEDNLENFCLKFNTTPFEDIHSMLEKVDIVVICSPNFCHVDHIVKSLNHNCDVLCEKPLTSNLTETNIIRHYNNIQNIKSINLNYRNLTVVKKIMDLIKDDKIGEIISIHMAFLKNSAYRRKTFTWRDDGSSKLSSGALGDLGVHLLDLATYITDSNVKVETIKTKMMTKVKQKSDNRVQVDDHSETFFMTSNGQYIHIETSKACDEDLCGFYISISGRNGEIKFSSKNGGVVTVNNDGIQEIVQLDERTYIDPENEFYGWKDSFYHTHIKFLEAIKNRKETSISTFEDGLRAQEVLEHCINSHQQKQYIEFK
ncbi:Gfo/Idh/MocA family oxidoreductase [Staphylococcus chromogenes]|uniref:Gfo/Idh/MocA family protein n=1 Tax=Staphylococcus chromogenes TaxID=46126 RepID=UPI001F1B29F7|nr:Gfo/Idh/MocA family oxidoreductase [Staphylococcus chromogenes]MCE5004874.1 Gfo/Idh/MocA family oxidoreductase [Staphylococcus chromogenes]